MDRKGVTFLEGISWLLGIAILLVILFLIFAPEQLLAKVRDAALSFGFGLVPGQEKPKFEGKTNIPKNVDNYFSNLLSQLSSLKENQNCLMDLNQIPFDGKYSIAIYNDKINIEKKGEIEEKSALTPAVKTATISGFKPCDVIGKAANNFHWCFIENNKGSCKDIYLDVNEIILNKEKYSNYALNSGKRLCFIRTYDDGIFDFGKCNFPRYDGNDGIDSDCTDKLKSSLCQ